MMQYRNFSTIILFFTIIIPSLILPFNIALAQNHSAQGITDNQGNILNVFNFESKLIFIDYDYDWTNDGEKYITYPFILKLNKKNVF
jgi:hypothetical protein